MAGDERRSEPDEGPVVPERPRRTPPTIDLTATETTSDSAAAPEPAPEPPAGEFQPGSARDFLSEETAAAVDDKTGGTGPRGGFSLGMLAAGFAGGLVVLVVLFVLWLTGLVPIRYAGSTAMRARVAVLEMQVQELANRPATGAKAREELAQRLDKVEQTLAQPPQAQTQAQAAPPDPALEQRLAAAEAAMKSLGNRVDAAETAAADAAAAAKAERAAHDNNNTAASAAPDPALVARLDAAARETAAAQAAMQASVQATLAGAAAEGTRIKTALAALALRDGALSGRPFAAELAAAKSLGVDAATLTALEPFAAAGVPGDAALAQELTPLLAALRTTSKASSSAEPAPAQGFLDRLESNASRLIRIRPVGEAATGSDPAAVIARAGTLAAKPDVAGAAAALKTLPADLRAPADQWIARVAARQAAREAAGGLAAVAARLLGPP